MKTDDGTMVRSGAPRRSVARVRQAVSPETGGVSISGDERRHLIAEAAYFRAEARGFAPGQELDDWLQAEAEVDTALLRH